MCSVIRASVELGANFALCGIASTFSRLLKSTCWTRASTAATAISIPSCASCVAGGAIGGHQEHAVRSFER